MVAQLSAAADFDPQSVTFRIHGLGGGSKPLSWGRWATEVKLLFTISALIALVNCNGFVGEVDGGRAKSSLVGEWSLATVNNGKPNEISVRSWRVNFHEDGTWSYEGEMSGAFAGMKTSGRGTWRTSDGTLEYTAGDQSGKSSFSLANGQLVLNPDPVLVFPGGKGGVATAYDKKSP